MTVKVKGKIEYIVVYRPINVIVSEPDEIGKSGESDTLGDLSVLNEDVLKVASIVGVGFALSHLKMISDHAESKIKISLKELCETDAIVYSPHQDTYYFSSTSLKNKCYSSLLYAQRRQLHRRMAEELERSGSFQLAIDYATLAHHWKLAENSAHASKFYEKAGRQAQVEKRFDPAQHYFRQALDLRQVRNT